MIKIFRITVRQRQGFRSKLLQLAHNTLNMKYITQK